MNEKRFEVLFYGDVINCVRDETGKEYNLQELINILMEQQDTINKLQDLCGESDSENAKLRIENKRLQKELNDCEKFRYTTFKRMRDVLDEWYNRINIDWFNAYWITLLDTKVVRMTEDKDKKICRLERENRRLKLINRLQKDIIENYQEIAELNNKVMIEWNDWMKKMGNFGNCIVCIATIVDQTNGFPFGYWS